MAAKKKKKKVAPKPKKKAVKKTKKKARHVVAAKKRAPAKRASAKRVASKKPAKKKVAKTKTKPVQRRDRPGHIDPRYAKKLLTESGKDGRKEQKISAFRVKDDDVAEELGEEVVGKATTGEDEGEDDANEEYVEEVGGPFVVTTGGEEFAEGTDESNPPDAAREPFPKT